MSLPSSPLPRRPLVLGSTSPYRRELLARLGLPFLTDKPEVDETPLPGEAPRETALRLSLEKAQAVGRRHPGSLVIGSDQVAILGDEIYGKPGNHENAVRQLRAMSGQTVEFLTGLCLLDTDSGRYLLRGIPTRVSFRSLSDQEIDTYLRRETPYQCAGSAKSEGLGIALIARMEGDDPNALIGLPLIALCDMLREMGMNPITDASEPS